MLTGGLTSRPVRPNVSVRRTVTPRKTAVPTRALFGLFDNSPEAKAKREEERRKKEEAKEMEYLRQQEVLMKRRTGAWREEVAQRRGQRYVEKRVGSIEPEPEIPWAEQKRLIEEAARAEAEQASKVNMKS